MGFLLALSCTLILYVTLYPFRFDFGLHEGSVLSLFMSTANNRFSRGDVVANVILFLPFGFFAMQRVLPDATRFIRIIFVIASGALFAFGIECAQNYLPGRVASIYDVAMNTVGVMFGAVLGWKDLRGKFLTSRKLKTGYRQKDIFPLILLGAWLGVQLVPFVPTLDVQNFNDALKPLFFGSFLPLDALRYFIVTMVVCRLVGTLTESGRLRMTLMFLPLGVIAIKPFIPGGSISQGKVFGTFLGYAVWWLILSRIRRNSGILAFLLAAQIVIQGLTPFVFNPYRGNFSFIPFVGFLKSTMFNNVIQFTEKTFLYGALLWLPIKTGLSLRSSLIFCVVLLTGIELAQMFLPGRVSEISDPLLAVILGIFLYFLDLRDETP